MKKIFLMSLLLSSPINAQVNTIETSSKHTEIILKLIKEGGVAESTTTKVDDDTQITSNKYYGRSYLKCHGLLGGLRECGFESSESILEDYYALKSEALVLDELFVEFGITKLTRVAEHVGKVLPVTINCIEEVDSNNVKVRANCTISRGFTGDISISNFILNYITQYEAENLLTTNETNNTGKTIVTTSLNSTRLVIMRRMNDYTISIGDENPAILMPRVYAEDMNKKLSTLLRQEIDILGRVKKFDLNINVRCITIQGSLPTCSFVNN